MSPPVMVCNIQNTEKRKCVNYIDKECDEKIVPPKKKVSFQNPPLSDFERKVIQKKSNERKILWNKQFGKGI